jgi:sulfide:quinone oxidoreductase
MTDSPLHVVVLGGGVAALETLLALRDLADERVRTTFVAPEEHFTYRPLSTAEPFALGHAQRHELADVARELGAELVHDSAVGIIPARHVVQLASGGELRYGALVVAVGARPARALPRGITFGEPGAREALQGMLGDLEEGYLERVAFVVPPSSSWPLPLYELALMTAAEVRGMGMDRVVFTLISTEPTPLSVFGHKASESVAELLEQAGIEFVGGHYANLDGDQLLLSPGQLVIDAQRVVSLPMLLGPGIDGLPGDQNGFVPVDEHGRVAGLDDVYAAGDATTYPIKQGGLATQQADAVAEAIAARAGAQVTPQPARPVLRGVLLTGGVKRFLRHELGGDDEGESGTRALWWPPNKIAGRYLSPYLHGRAEGGLPTVAGALPVEVAVGGAPHIEVLGG